VPPGKSEAVKFPIENPLSIQKALVWRIVATAGDKAMEKKMHCPFLQIGCWLPNRCNQYERHRHKRFQFENY
jgi:hypothetical protein